MNLIQMPLLQLCCQNTDIVYILSAFANHIIESKHEYSLSDWSFLHNCNKGIWMDLLQISEIHKVILNQYSNGLQKLLPLINYIFLSLPILDPNIIPPSLYFLIFISHSPYLYLLFRNLNSLVF